MFNILLLAAIFFACFQSCAATVSTRSKVGCLTKISTKSTSRVQTSTVSATFIFHPRVTSTTTLTQTVTPSSTTITTISTATSTTLTTLPSTTDTFTITTTGTILETITNTLTSTNIISETVTTTVTTVSTISTSSGFTPLASALSASGYAASKKRRSLRHSNGDDALIEARSASRSGMRPDAPKASSIYPVAVKCYRYVEIFSTSTIIATARTTPTITLPAGTVTVTSTTTLTTTTSIIPIEASTTLTSSTATTLTLTNTITAAILTTQTTTSTAFAPVSTFYAACANNNLVSQVNGVTISNFGPETYGYSQAGNTASAYDCCVLCQQTASCGASFYEVDSIYSQGACFIVNNSGTCTADTASEQDAVLVTNLAFTLVASNGACGQTYFNNNQ